MNPNEIKKKFEELTNELSLMSQNKRAVLCGTKDLLKIFKNTLAYINQLEAENKAFGKIIKKQDDEISVLRKDLLKRQNLEENFSKVKKQFDKKMLKQVKFERADAVKEFAEKMKGVILEIDDTYIERIVEDYIDNLLKEMVGDDVATK